MGLTMKRYTTDTYGQGETVVSSLQSNEAFVANKFTMWNQRVRVCKFDSRDAAIDATENPYAGNAYDDTNTGTSVGCDRADDANVYMLVADGKPFQYPKDYFKVQSCKYNKLEALKECLEKDKGACRNTATPPRYRSDTNEYRAKMQLNIFAPRTDGLSSDASLCPDVYNDALTSNAFYLPSDDTGLVGTCNTGTMKGNPCSDDSECGTSGEKCVFECTDGGGRDVDENCGRGRPGAQFTCEWEMKNNKGRPNIFTTPNQGDPKGAAWDAVSFVTDYMIPDT